MANDVESALSSTADHFEELLRADPALSASIVQLLDGNMKPQMFRLLDNVLPAGYMLTMVISPQPT